MKLVNENKKQIYVICKSLPSGVAYISTNGELQNECTSSCFIYEKMAAEQALEKMKAKGDSTLYIDTVEFV